MRSRMFSHHGGRPPLWRSKFIGFLLIVFAIAIFSRAAFIALSPAHKLKAALLVVNVEPAAGPALLAQVQVLNTISADIENTSIATLREALSKTARLAERATREFEAQYQSWTVLRGHIKNDGTTYNELRRQLEQTQSLQDREILRLQQALSKAQKPSIWSEFSALSLSFFLGILSSVLATMFWEKWPRLSRWWGSQVEPPTGPSSGY